MKIDSINIGRPEAVDPESPDKRSGIFKRPVDGPVAVTRLGIAKDAVVNAKHHGGPDQALYLYTADDYQWWADQGVATGPGQFGENLTVSGIESGELCIGDWLIVHGVEFEVTAPRVPCATFAAKMGDPGFVKRFRKAARPGAYLRVISEGRIAPGQAMQRVPYEGDRMTLAENFEIYFQIKKRAVPRETIERVLALPVAARARELYEKYLASV